MQPVADPELTAQLAASVLAGDRGAVARAVTLVESHRADHREQAQALLATLLPHLGAAVRVGISGVPGVGKSTFIDALGGRLIDAGHRVAVLAVDPSSALSGGSILGDRTRMTRLSVDPAAFVRPSPSRGTLGGVASSTRAAMLVMQAAGFDVILVETVGVGQSEYLVADMVDTFLFLTLARTGDELQGVKRGILELADVVAVNKADGDQQLAAQRAAQELAGALHLMRGSEAWQPPVLTCSALTGDGLDEVWRQVQLHRAELGAELGAKRQRQLLSWTDALVAEGILAVLDRPDVAQLRGTVHAQVLAGTLTPAAAAEQILAHTARISVANLR